MTKNQNFGRYLKELRISRGFAHITDYLDAHNLPISESYYRDLESGRNIIALETAEELCLAIGAEPESFYVSLLLDLLPESLINVVLEERYRSNIADVRGKEESSKATNNVVYANEMAVKFFRHNLYLLPVVDFIYFHDLEEGVSIQDLGQFLENSEISYPLEELCKLLIDYEIALPVFGKHKDLIALRKIGEQFQWRDLPLEYHWFRLALDSCWNRRLPPMPRFPELNLRYFRQSYPVDPAVFNSIEASVQDTFSYLRNKGEAIAEGEDAEPFFFAVAISPNELF